MKVALFTVSKGDEKWRDPCGCPRRSRHCGFFDDNRLVFSGAVEEKCDSLCWPMGLKRFIIKGSRSRFRKLRDHGGTGASWRSPLD